MVALTSLLSWTFVPAGGTGRHFCRARGWRSRRLWRRPRCICAPAATTGARRAGSAPADSDHRCRCGPSTSSSLDRLCSMSCYGARPFKPVHTAAPLQLTGFSFRCQLLPQQACHSRNVKNARFAYKHAASVMCAMLPALRSIPQGSSGVHGLRSWCDGCPWSCCQLISLMRRRGGQCLRPGFRR